MTPITSFYARTKSSGSLARNGARFQREVTYHHALQNAGSIAGLMLTTEAVVSDIPEKEKERTPSMPADMDY